MCNVRYVRLLAALTIIVVPAGMSEYRQASAASSTMTTAEIFYVSFGGDPYSPITRSNIEDEHVRYGRVKVEDANFQRLMTILSGAPAGHGCFNPKRVRVKIHMANSIVYVDETGAVERSRDIGFLSEENRNLVQRLVAFALTDFRPTKRPPHKLPLEELDTCN